MDELMQDPDFLENIKKSPLPLHYQPNKLSLDWYTGFLQGQGCNVARIVDMVVAQAYALKQCFHSPYTYCWPCINFLDNPGKYLTKKTDLLKSISKIVNGIGKIDLMKASKWRCQLVQVGRKKEFGEDFVVGLVDACGRFGVSFKLLTNFWPVIRVHVHLDISGKDYELLQEIQRKLFQGRGKIYYRNNCPFLTIHKFSDIVEVIVPFFLRNPLMSYKYYSFLTFCTIVYKINLYDRLDNDVVKEIVSIAYSMYSNQIKTSDMRLYTQEQLFEYLDMARTKDAYKRLRKNLQKIRDDLKDKWKKGTGKKTVKAQS